MPIVVTGAWGQLGGELCRQLGAAALPLDVDTLDLTDGPAVRARIGQVKPEAVINCAAYTQVDKAESEPDACRAVNARAVEHLAGVCGELGCPLVQISTDYVFCGRTDHSRPCREDDPVAPEGVYAVTKHEGELAAVGCPQHLVVRTCGLYARPSDPRARNFVRTMLDLGRTHSELRVVDDQYCTPSYVPHVARAVLFLAGASGGRPAPWGVYHVTNRGATTWYELAGEVFRRAGIEVSLAPITTAEYAAPAPRPAFSVLDTSKYEALGGPPLCTWQEALDEYFRELDSLPWEAAPLADRPGGTP